MEEYKAPWPSIFDAAKKADKKAIQYYIDERYAELDKTQNGKTPAYIAFEHKHHGIGLTLIEAKCRNLVGPSQPQYLSKTFSRGRTILHVSAQSSDIETFKKLTDKFNDFDLLDDSENNALMVACANKGQKAVVEHLHSLNPNLIHQKNKSGRTALHIALYKGCDEIAAWLLSLPETKQYLNDPDNEGYKPIHLSVFGNNKICVEKLIEKGVDIDEKKDGDETTALHIAAQYDKQAALSALTEHLQEKNVNVKDRYGRTPAHFAAMNGAHEILSYLKDRGADLNAMATGDSDEEILQGTLLHYAVHGREFFTVQQLLNADDVVEVSKSHDETGITALHLACETGEDVIVKMLKESKAPYALTKDNRSELHFACKSQSYEIVEILLEENRFVNQKSDDGVLPIHVAAKHSTEQVVDILIENGASYKSRIGENEENAIHIASNSGNVRVLKYFIDNEEIEAQLKNGLGLELLIGAAKNGQDKSIELLLKSGVPIDAVDKYQKTALHHLVQVAATLLNDTKNSNDAKNNNKIKRYKDAIECLLRLGANYNLKDNHGRTPLNSVEKTPGFAAGAIRSVKFFKKKSGKLRYENEEMARFMRALIKQMKAEVRASYFAIEKQLKVKIERLEKRAAMLEKDINNLVVGVFDRIENERFYDDTDKNSELDNAQNSETEKHSLHDRDDKDLWEDSTAPQLPESNDASDKGKEEESSDDVNSLHDGLVGEGVGVVGNVNNQNNHDRNDIENDELRPAPNNSPKAPLSSFTKYGDMVKEKLDKRRKEMFGGFNLIPAPSSPPVSEEDSFDAWTDEGNSLEGRM